MLLKLGGDRNAASTTTRDARVFEEEVGRCWQGSLDPLQLQNRDLNRKKKQHKKRKNTIKLLNNFKPYAVRK